VRKGWEVRKLGDICEIARGGSPRPIQQFITNDPSGVNWIKISDATASGKYIYNTKEKITRAGVQRSRMVNDGDFILSNSMSFGRPYIMKTSGCIHDGWLVLSDKRGVFDQDYLYHFLGSNSAYRQFDNLAAGSTVRNLNIDLAKRVEVPLPPLNEQKRIVAILDEAFEGVAAVVANAEKNLANARELFESYLNSVFANESSLVAKASKEPAGKNARHVVSHENLFDIEETTKTGGRAATTRHIPLSVGMPKIAARKGWNWLLLTALARLELGHTPSRRHPEYWGGDVPWIGIRDAKRFHGEDITETEGRVNQLGLANSSARLLPSGTVCLSRTASVGYVCVMGRPMATSQDFVNWVCGNELNPHFLKYLLMAQGDEIFKFSSGAVHQTIYFPEAKAFHVCIPDLDEQARIVTQADSLKENSEHLQSIYRKKLSDLTELKQSILQKAFAGELTAQPQQFLQEAVA
jgi:restriction endonuclease S subunit